MPEGIRITSGVVMIAVGSAVAIAVVQQLVMRLATRVPSRYRFRLLSLSPILRLVILSAAFLLIIRIIAQDNDILVLLGAGIVAIGFAFQDYISSIIAGIITLYERPYQPGDWIAIDGDYGEVKSIGMWALKIVTPDDTAVMIPHRKIWSANLANANDGEPDHLCVTDFYLNPTHDAYEARQTLYDVGMTSPYTNLNKAVTVIVLEKPWGTHYRLKAYPVDGRTEFQFISDLTVRGKTALAEAEIAPASAPAAVAVST